MVHHWRSFPVVRLLFPFLLGIGVALETGMPAVDLGIILAGLCSWGLLLLGYLVKPAYRFRWLSGTVILFNFLVLGFITVRTSERLTDHRYGPIQKGLWICRVTGLPKVNSKTIQVPVQVFRRDSIQDALNPVCGSILSFYHRVPVDEESCNETLASELQHGDWILIESNFDPIPEPVIPGAFDARTYYRIDGITHRGMIKTSRWCKISLSSGQISIKRVAMGWREKMKDILLKTGMQLEERAVVNALLLGDKRELDPELRQGYANTGAMHILAVSGMHVGIIYLFLEFLLSFLKKWRHGIRIQSVILLLMIWLYALITGLSPSVFRAAIMISFIIVARATHRYTQMFNTLALSMLFILLFNPALLYGVGFQLSYLAVLGIMVLYKPIKRVIPVTNWAGDKLWSLAAVSLAAQTGTFPLVLHVFQQFPNYFLLTNLLIAPLASLIMYTGIGVLAGSFVPWIFEGVSWLLNLLVWILNQVIHFIDQLPGTTTPGNLSTWEMWGIYAMMIMVIMGLTWRSKKWLLASLVLLLLISTAWTWSKWERVKTLKTGIRTESFIGKMLG